MIKVTHDLFFIAQRLKRINPNYVVYRNNQYNRYEVHTRVGKSTRTVLEFVIPYDGLDVRTIEYAMKTRRQNADMIEQEINEHNAEIHKSIQKTLDTANQQLEDALRYAKRAGHAVAFTKDFCSEF